MGAIGRQMTKTRSWSTRPCQSQQAQLKDKISLKGTQLTEGGEAKDGRPRNLRLSGSIAGNAETFTGPIRFGLKNRLYTDYSRPGHLWQADDYQVRLAVSGENPKELDQVISRVKALSLDWDQTQLTANSQAFEQVASTYR